MQMGRWFGFRPGYLDACRLFTTDSLYASFSHISMATEDLAAQFDFMNSVVQTPRDFGLRVASHPTLEITSRNKMRTGQEFKRDFSCKLSQTRVFDIDGEQYDRNFEAVEDFLYAIKGCRITTEQYQKTHNRKAPGEHIFYQGVSAHDVANFLESYETSKTATRANSKYMADVLLDKAYMFDCAKTIARSPSAITANIWPEDCYVSLNVVYKMSKNHQKLLKTLKKHKKKLLEYADVYADERKKSDIESNDIALRSYEAFSAIKQFFDEKLEADKLKDVIEPAIMIQRMLSKSKEIFDNHLVVDKCDYAENGDLVAYIKSYAVFDYLKALLGTDSNGYEINQDVLCAADFGAPQKRKRFIVIGIKKSLTDTVQLPIGIFSEKDYRTVQDAIGDLQNVPTVTDVAEDIGTPLKKADDISELGKSLRDTDTLFNHIITKTRETAMERFKVIKQGENFHSLNDSLKTNTYTDANRTQNTIYLRLAYNQPSGTVVNVRKSMWIHPELNRAISIREAARLQTFPDSFIFCGSKDKQYQQVGNAVPPIMAKAIAEKLADQLEQIEKRYER